MGKPNEQVQGKFRNFVCMSRRYIKWVKRSTSKYNRRKGKKLLDDAPPHNRYQGYAD